VSMLTLYSVSCVVLVGIGIVLFVEGFPLIADKAHKKVSAFRDYYFDGIPMWIQVKMETLDAFTANNPIDVEMSTTPINLDEVRVMQLSFEGAKQYFPTKPMDSPTMPPIGSPQEVWDQYKREVEEYWDTFEKYMKDSFEKAGLNMLFLRSDKDISDFNLPENSSLPKFSTFSGTLQNLTYSTGGKFDIGITVTKANGEVIGYGMSDLSYVLKEAIEVSPPETLLEIQNRNIMSGLGWIGLGLPFLIAGLTGLLEILKHYTFTS